MDDYSSLPMTPEQALTFLSGPDAIMETKVEDAIRVYLEANLSSTDVAIDALAQGYCANAQVCNMMCDWLAALGDDPINLSKKSKNKEHDRSKTSPPKSPTKKFDDKTFEPCDGRLEAAKCIEDTLAGLITKYFSPEMADKIFEDGGVIDWLPELIAHRRWRSFLYELIEQFPHCLMLNFAVKLISDAGFQTEISNVNTAAQQLDIFSRVLLTSIDAVLEEHKKGFPTTAYEKAFGELVRVVCQSEHTYVYALALLKMVGKSEKGWISAACEQMSEALRARLLGREHETTALRTAISQIADDQVATHVVQALLTMTSKGELNPADITIIYDQFIMPHPPPIEVIRDVVLEDLLLDALFHCDGPKVVVEHRDKYVFLLAYIASVTETVNKNGQRTQIRLELDACRQSLDRTVCLLESSDDLLGELSDLIHAVRMPIVAAGVLYYVKSLLLSDARLGDPPSAALCLLDHISTLHPSLHSRTFVVCCQLYEKISRDADAAEVIMERQRSVVDRFVHLLSVGAAIPVLEKISSMFREAHIDASLVRYFAVEVLEIVCPPYSADIVSLLLPLVADNEIFDRGMQEKVPAAGEFLQHCEQFLPLSQMPGDFSGANDPLWAVICKVDNDCVHYWIPEAGYGTKKARVPNSSKFDIGQWIVVSDDGSITQVDDAPVPTFIIKSKGCRLVKIDTLVTVPPISWQPVNRRIDRSTHDTVAVSSDFGIVYNGMYKSKKIVSGKLYKVFIVNMGSRGVEDDVDKALRSVDSLWAIPNQIPEEITDLEILEFSRDMLINYNISFDLLENTVGGKTKSIQATVPEKVGNSTVHDRATEKDKLTQVALHESNENDATVSAGKDVKRDDLNQGLSGEVYKQSLHATLPLESGERYEKAMTALRKLLSNNSIRDKMIEQQEEAFKIVDAYLSSLC